jgi:hypothetical protein
MATSEGAILSAPRRFTNVSPAMMMIYSHVRGKALNEAAVVLHPNFELAFPTKQA